MFPHCFVSCGFSGYTLSQYPYQPFRSFFIVELLRMYKCEEIHVTRCVHTDFPNTALSSEKDKIQAVTNIWEETLKALVLFPFKSHCPICFQRGETFLVILSPNANTSPLILVLEVVKESRFRTLVESFRTLVESWFALSSTCPIIRSLLSDFIGATVFPMTMKLSLIGASLVSLSV